MHHIKHHIKERQGQTIIEAVIALATIMLTLAAISVAITTSLSNSEFAKSQSLAARYAQEGIEKIRYLRNIDPAGFKEKSENGGIYCMGEEGNLSTTGGVCNPQVNALDIIDNAFIRQVEFSTGTPGCPVPAMQVTVEVNWSSPKCSSDDRFCHNINLVSCFSEAESSSGTTL